MFPRRKTQKEIAEKYEGSLDYYSKIHGGKLARFLVCLLGLAVALAAIITFQKRGNETFFNPGPLSRAHAGLVNDCAKCHDKSLLAGGQLTEAKFKEVLSERFRKGIAFEPIDKRCETCHTAHTFHEPNVVQDRSCSVCHQEHEGAGPMKAVASFQCASCHNKPATMEASAQKGMQLQWAAFQRHPPVGHEIDFQLPRPSRGYTQTFASFWSGHPEFQLNREPVRDPDVLHFNHQRHFAADIPLVNGKKLDCNYCHQTDPDGRYYQRISFAAHCQSCHSLQFDAKNPELILPHGNPTAVRGFLLTLPAQYRELALKKGITQPNEIQNFVTKQMIQLRERFRSEGKPFGVIQEEIERQVFFVTDPYKLQRESEPRARASFYGCALCHEVKPVANAAPFIAKPTFVDRWMPQSAFNHAQHTMVKCDDC